MLLNQLMASVGLEGARWCHYTFKDLFLAIVWTSLSIKAILGFFHGSGITYEGKNGSSWCQGLNVKQHFFYCILVKVNYRATLDLRPRKYTPPFNERNSKIILQRVLQMRMEGITAVVFANYLSYYWSWKILRSRSISSHCSRAV